MKLYYRSKNYGEEYILYEEIQNGVVLTKFDPETGIRFGNQHYKIFVPRDYLKEHYEVFDFILPVVESDKKILASTLDKISYQMWNTGICEESVSELRSSLPFNVFRELAENEKFNLEDREEYDDIEHSMCEESFNFIKTITPVIKELISVIRKEAKNV